MNPTIDQLREYEARGLVHGSRHPSLPLTVWSYTRTAQFDRVWDEVTTNTRGLVLHDDGTMVGRGITKFGGYGDPMFPIPPRDQWFTAFDKADGSLICVTEYEGELLVWSKGSFTSPHAESAAQYLKGWRPNPGTTALFEGVFGHNRVVVDYGEFRGLILLGEVDHDTGKDWTHPDDVALDTGWGGETVIERNGISVEEMVAICADPENGRNREGFVVVWPRENAPAVRTKIKFARYLQLHKVMTGLTARRVHENYLQSLTTDTGMSFWNDFLEGIPDEMDEAVRNCVDDIKHRADVQLMAAQRVLAGVPKGIERREVAKILSEVDHDTRSLVWSLYDGRKENAFLQAVSRVVTETTPLIQVNDDGDE